MLLLQPFRYKLKDTRMPVYGCAYEDKDYMDNFVQDKFFIFSLSKSDQIHRSTVGKKGGQKIWLILFMNFFSKKEKIRYVAGIRGLNSPL